MRLVRVSFTSYVISTNADLHRNFQIIKLTLCLRDVRLSSIHDIARVITEGSHCATRCLSLLKSQNNGSPFSFAPCGWLDMSIILTSNT